MKMFLYFVLIINLIFDTLRRSLKCPQNFRPWNNLKSPFSFCHICIARQTKGHMWAFCIILCFHCWLFHILIFFWKTSWPDETKPGRDDLYKWSWSSMGIWTSNENVNINDMYPLGLWGLTIWGLKFYIGCNGEI